MLQDNPESRELCRKFRHLILILPVILGSFFNMAASYGVSNELTSDLSGALNRTGLNGFIDESNAQCEPVVIEGTSLQVDAFASLGVSSFIEILLMIGRALVLHYACCKKGENSAVHKILVFLAISGLINVVAIAAEAYLSFMLKYDQIMACISQNPGYAESKYNTSDASEVLALDYNGVETSSFTPLLWCLGELASSFIVLLAMPKPLRKKTASVLALGNTDFSKGLLNPEIKARTEAADTTSAIRVASMAGTVI